jgi:hypothetical protein
MARFLIFFSTVAVIFSYSGCRSEDTPEPPSESSNINGSVGYYLTNPDEPDSIKRDRIELDVKHELVFASIDSDVEKALKDHPRKGKLGFCHVFRETKKELLLQKHGIVWLSPAELNPNIIYD